jgi:hypothetical protein
MTSLMSSFSGGDERWARNCDEHCEQKCQQCREHKAKGAMGRPCAKLRPVAVQGTGRLMCDSGSTLIGNKQVEPGR